MTIIAYRDGVLAADKQSTFSNQGITTTKIRRLASGALAGATGDTGMCRELIAWYEAGANPEKYPDRKSDCHLVIITQSRQVFMFDGTPYGVEVEDAFLAVGSGRDYAVAAMHLGLSAAQAVELASQYDIFCGKGVDILELEPDAAP